MIHMRKSIMRRPSVAAVTAALLSTVTLTAPAAADPDTILASCTGGSANIKIDRETHEVNGTATLSGCTAVGHPAIHSATIAIQGTALVSMLEIATFTADTITWNTGQTTTLSGERTFTGAVTVVAAGAGESLAGLFHPSLGTESGIGTRTNPTLFSSSIVTDISYNFLTQVIKFAVDLPSTTE
jgi:hypothetical protein